MQLFQLGDFTLSSGVKSRWKIDCDAIPDGDIQTLADMIRQLVGDFSSVEGIPRGGLRLAEALRPFCAADGPHLLVDDVLTSGGSLRRAAVEYRGQKRLAGAVIFARGQCPPWVQALFQMPSLFNR